MKKITLPLAVAALLCSATSLSAELAYTDQDRLHDIAADVSAERIEQDIRKLVGFGTRHTLSDTKSDTRGIGAARRLSLIHI